MTDIDDYRAFLNAKLKSAASILRDAETRKESGEITKSNYISMWRREIKRIQGELDKENTDPIVFAEDGDIWARKMKIINAQFERKG